MVCGVGHAYVAHFNGDSSKKFAEFCTLIAPAGNGVDVAVSKELDLQVKDRFENTLYGFFRGKRVAYPVVE